METCTDPICTIMNIHYWVTYENLKNFFKFIYLQKRRTSTEHACLPDLSLLLYCWNVLPLQRKNKLPSFDLWDCLLGLFKELEKLSNNPGQKRDRKKTVKINLFLKIWLILTVVWWDPVITLPFQYFQYLTVNQLHWKLLATNLAVVKILMFKTLIKSCQFQFVP